MGRNEGCRKLEVEDDANKSLSSRDEPDKRLDLMWSVSWTMQCLTFSETAVVDPSRR